MGGHSARVLVIDDDPSVADLLRTGLLERGYNVETVSGIRRGRCSDIADLCGRFCPHLVVIDPWPSKTESPSAELLSELQSCKCVLYSEYTKDPENLKWKFERKRMDPYCGMKWVDKGEDLEALLREIALGLREDLLANQHLTVRWPREWSPQSLAEMIVPGRHAAR